MAMTKRTTVIALALVAIAGSAAAAAPTAATPEAAKAQARSLYEEGTRHYNLNEFPDALTSFKEAYRLYPEPTFLFNIAQCQRQMGRKQEAVLSYRAFLRESPDAPNRGDVEALIGTLERAIREDAAARVAPIPQTPVIEDSARAAEDAAATRKRARTLRFAGIGVGVAGVAALGVGIGLCAAAKHDANTISSADKSGGVYDPGVYSQGNTFNAAGIALISVGAAAAVAGTVMIAVGARRKREVVASAASHSSTILTVGY
jgi:tetratricopeptide (TPR) repeat protein